MNVALIEMILCILASVARAAPSSDHPALSRRQARPQHASRIYANFCDDTTAKLHGQLQTQIQPIPGMPHAHADTDTHVK